ncbi:MAG: acyl-CoA thioesterase [Candidatus Omnitrophica bacterium]|nr:acyl-CoA thioesterase [Candidatus Omnitrophota bacterium]
MKKRIYYYDTDCGGVVYYANYLKYLEEARTEYFEKRGIFVKDIWAKGIGFVVARQEIDYKLPAVYDDVLEIDTRVKNISRASAEFEYDIRNQKAQVISTAKTVLVFVDKNLKPKAIPEDIKAKLAAH